MNNKKIRREKTNSPQEPYRFSKRHGSTIFTVTIHSGNGNNETAGEKILRLIRHDLDTGKAVNL